MNNHCTPPVQLQDPSNNSFVVPFGNRIKAGQSYQYPSHEVGNNNNSSNNNNMKTSAAAVSLSKNVKDMFGMLVMAQPSPQQQDATPRMVSQLASSSIIIPTKKHQQTLSTTNSAAATTCTTNAKVADQNNHNNNNNPLLFLPSTSYPVDLYLPSRDVVCQMYCCYLVLMAIISLILPYYAFYLAVMLCPLFTVSVLGHCMVLYSFWNTFLGIVICILYPMVVIFSMMPWALSVFVVLMLVFCNLGVMLQVFGFFRLFF